MKYIDIHAHLPFKEFDADRALLISDMREKEIGVINVGTGFQTSKEAVEMAEANENMYATIGVHPIDEKTGDFNVEDFAKLVVHPKVVAIGECGLDYARLLTDSGQALEEKLRQKALFEAQIDFACAHRKPLMIHCREAYPDCLEILKLKKAHYGDVLHAHFHFFTSPVEVARQCLRLYFSLWTNYLK
jgi:TatD DNase family protein